MRSSSGFFGVLGLGLLLFAFVLTLFTRGAGPFDVMMIGTHLVGGIACLVIYLSSGIHNLRDFLSERSTRYGTSTILATIFFVGILAALNFLSSRYHTRWDMSESGAFSLSRQTLSVLGGLDSEVQMDAFVQGGTNPTTEDLLSRYASTGPLASFRMIDPDRQPELAERHAIRQYNTVRVSYGDEATTVIDPSEETLTNAIIKLSREAEVSVCVLTGHGEPSFQDEETASGFALAKRAIVNENYAIEEVLLPSQERIPKTCEIAMMVGPSRPFLDHEIDALDAFVRRGGGLLALIPPRASPQLVAFFKRWGIAIGNDVVVDQIVRLFQGPSLGLAPLVDDYDDTHEITHDLNERSLFPIVRSVSALKDPRDGMDVKEIVRTSPSSWAESDIEAVFDKGTATLDADDQRGPIPIVAAATIDLTQLNKPGNGEARIVVVGSVEFADNQNLEGTFFNRDLFLNSVGWLAGQGDLLSIRPNALRASRVNFTRQEGTLIFYLSVLVIPELLLMLGLYIWWHRG